MATTMVRVEPSGTMPLIGLAHGPFPFWISIQQSTLSPVSTKRKPLISFLGENLRIHRNRKRKFTSEVELDDFEIGDDHGRFGGRLLVVVVPLAAEPLGLVPDLDQLLVVLDDDRVLVEFALGVRLGPAAVVDDGEAEVGPARFRVDVDAIVLAELALGEDQTGERFVEGQLHFHVILGAHDFEILNLRQVNRSLLLPWLLTQGVLAVSHLIGPPKNKQIMKMLIIFFLFSSRKY